MAAKFKNLDPLLHSQLRLAIVSILVGLDSADFNHILKETEASKGNLSVQLTKLKEAGYIEVKKSFENNYPKTTCKITKKGIESFEDYVKNLQTYLK